MRRSEPKLSEFGPAVAWLLEKDVPSGRIATLFQTTAENVRVIAFRARHAASTVEQEFALVERPAPELAESLGVRPSPDEVVRTGAGTRKLDWLTAEIETVVARHRADYSFLDGLPALHRLAPGIGFPADARRIALSARLHQHMAWFLVHAGRSLSAAEEARTARDLWRVAYHESSCREYAERFVQSALIGSHAWLLSRRPREALTTLQLADAAAASIGAPLGSDHYRQRGVALFQLREDQRATEAFRRSAEAMEKLQEARVPAQMMMTGVRHIHLLGSLNWDGATEVLATARKCFGDQSLEASMALHWAVACGVSTDSSSVIHDAVELTETHPLPADQFGHQLTIRKLLGITPELGLDSRLRRAWARRALYENAFRNRQFLPRYRIRQG